MRSGTQRSTNARSASPLRRLVVPIAILLALAAGVTAIFVGLGGNGSSRPTPGTSTTTPAEDPTTAATPTPTGSSAPSYDVVLIIGQSNAQGETGGVLSPTLDIPDPRIFSFGATGDNAMRIVPASDPLAHRGGYSTAVGPGMPFARGYLDTVPDDRRVLLVPAAAAATAFGSGSHRWDPTAVADHRNLYELAIQQTLAALEAAPNSRLAAIIWVQGESDILVTEMPAETYRVYLEQLIDGMRERLDAPEVPFIIGSMVPEYIASGPLPAAIDKVHEETPTRKAFTTYVAGPRGMHLDDGLHYTADGQREFGKRMVDAVADATTNDEPANKVPADPPTATAVPRQ
jgi:hypothetical protein